MTKSKIDGTIVFRLEIKIWELIRSIKSIRN